MDISTSKDPHRILRNSVLGVDGIPQLPKGTWIVYHTGRTWSLSETARRVGSMARELREMGRVILCQRKTGDDQYDWIAVVR